MYAINMPRPIAVGLTVPWVGNPDWDLHEANEKVRVKVLDTVSLGPPIVTFPHPGTEVFVEVSIANVPHRKGA